MTMALAGKISEIFRDSMRLKHESIMNGIQ